MTEQQWDKCVCCGADCISDDELCEECRLETESWFPPEREAWEHDEPVPEDE